MTFSKIGAALLSVAILSACAQNNQKETIGTIIGGATGAVVGSQFGKGKGGIAAVAIGTLAGAWLGNSVGRSLDELDRMKLEQTTQRALETNPIGQQSTWSNPDSGNSGSVTPTKTVYNPNSSEPCREYSSTVTIDGQLETITGTACRRPDGTWRTVD
ncbi:RT0821/Lpp0805 family surface protein [Terasakiella pusilla]|uniref:RT0821/Lpp0805 family surface protein n=1 Tax=Terasakiella pusilla TaxID=64973 RepID=UPI00048F6B42|nr:RT0821/Lpp0805 family surface protein [Terasakiella pusilla]